ncbi:MAG: helix-turn-helix domain-containing protein [Lachnospiraceae bacterium]
MKTWDGLLEELNLSEEEEELIRIQEELILTMIKAREEKHLSQAQLARICNVKQPVIARMESGKHSPQVDSLLRILLPLGYTLKIVPKEI